jgi:hypothetical protein
MQSNNRKLEEDMMKLSKISEEQYVCFVDKVRKEK